MPGTAPGIVSTTSTRPAPHDSSEHFFTPRVTLTGAHRLRSIARLTHFNVFHEVCFWQLPCSYGTRELPVRLRRGPMHSGRKR